jgi:hypothetical protein
MQKTYGTLISALLLNCFLSARSQHLKGFTDDHAKAQLQLEASYDKSLSAANTGATIKELSSRTP